MKKNNLHTLRFWGIAVLFCLIGLIYLGRLFYIQVIGREEENSSQTTTRLVTIQAVRGEIYDRNGNALVKNKYTYDLSLSYQMFESLPKDEQNRAALALLNALEATGESDKHAEKFFPMEGSYPMYFYSAEATDGDSLIFYRLKRVIREQALNEDISAGALADHYIKAHDLLAKRDGKQIYTDAEIDRLIRLYYDMDALRFGENADYTVATDIGLSLLTHVKEAAIPAHQILYRMERVYCYPGYASHILGTVGPIYAEDWGYYNEQGYQMNATVGKSGCESAFESYLHGIDGTMLIEEDANGRVISSTVKKEPVAGSDVYLTLDIDLQIAAEDGLRYNTQYVVEHSGGSASKGAECNAGAAVAMDPNTFEILAIASYPTFDLSTYNLDYNDLAANSDLPLLNRAINGTYAPGSTFKVGMALIGLLEGTISPTSTYTCTGEYDRQYSNKGVGCSTYTTAGYEHSAVEIIEAIAKSCNSFFCDLGKRLGIEKIEEYMSAFGIGEATGLELGGSQGILAGPAYRQSIRSEEPWDNDLTLIASIGQSDNQASPLQLAAYLSTIVNGGSRYSSHLLHSVYAFGANTPSVTYTAGEDKLLDYTEIPRKSLDLILQSMEEMVKTSSVVSRSMRNITDKGITVGGKTGTAQNSSGCDNALFVCQAKSDAAEAPEIVISVVLEKGASGGNASITAGKILEEFYKGAGEN